MRRKTVLLTIFAAAAVLIVAGTTVSRPLHGGPQEVVAALPSGWSAPVNISNEGGNSEAPTIAVDLNGRVYATWTEWYGGIGAPRGMLFNSTNASGKWGTTTGSALFYPGIDDVGFPVVACHPTNGHAYQLYHDGDLANANMEILFREYVGNVEANAEWMSLTPNSSSYVTAAVNPLDSTLYAVWMDDVSGTDTFELGLKYRNPSTGAWSAGDVIPTGIGGGKYWPHLNFDAKGTAHLLFITRPPAVIYYMKNATPQNPSTWTVPINLSGDTARDWVAPRLAADKDGDVYVAWYGNTGGYESATEEVWFNKTVNGDWQTKANLTNNPLRSEGPSVAVNPLTKDIYLAYHELSGVSDWEVMLLVYETQPNGQRAWSKPINMTQSPGHDGEPSIRVDSKGGIHLAYHYLQTDYNMEIYYTTKAGGVQPPTGVALTTLIETSGTKKTNRITWTNSNASADVASNKIWRKISTAADNTFALLGTAGAAAVQYDDTGLDPQTKYAYRVTVAPAASGAESDPSVTVAEGAGRVDLPPANLTVTGGVNKVLFFREKLNIVKFEANSGNLAAEVSGYEIYRKLTSEADSALARIATLTPSTLTYNDGRLPLTGNYSYAVKTKFTDAKLSAFSKVVADK
jgi:hypothetical protein